jgi:hypothetical protein
MKKTILSIFILLLFLQSCATYKPHYEVNSKFESFPNDKKIEHTFFLFGDAGDRIFNDTILKAEALTNRSNKDSNNSTLLFLGDNIYPAGMPKKEDNRRMDAEKRIQHQINMASSFQGNTIFIPGNHDWYSEGVKGLKRQQEWVESKLGKNSFLPKEGCPIKTINISENIVLIIVDSQWYITNWNNHPTINENCDIKTRAAFLEEFRTEIKKARGKTTIVAIHHPMFSNGPHGGQYAFNSYLKPLPILGSLKNLIRRTTGISEADIQNKMYNELKKNLVAAAQQNNKVVFISGHEHSLQYIVEDNLVQIISGSASKITETRNIKGGKFSFGTKGYAKLDVFDDGSSFVSFISLNDMKTLYQNTVLLPDNKKQEIGFPVSFPATFKSSIYSLDETNKSKFYKFLWGNRYRNQFSKQIEAKTVNLDTLFGGLKPTRKGGGSQSKSLRLKSKDGKDYVIRAIEKNAIQYIQSTIFKDQYIEGKFRNTVSEGLIRDVFTASYPYAPFVMADLSDAIGLHHLNPKLYYIPKQNALGNYNDEFGNELYLLEEHASDGNLSLNDKNYTGNISSTLDLLIELQTDESKMVDEAAYIKARLFDMLINDWDRHQDQWRWLEFKENGKTIFKPLPRDRDQAFSIMSDGFILGAAVKLIPAAKLLRKYSSDLKDVKGFNVEPYPLDVVFMKTASKEVWDEQVALIQKNLTDDVIEKAFLNVPIELNDETLTKIKKTLSGRKNKLQQIADRYFKLINKYVVITATNKEDLIKIEGYENGNVKVSLFRKKKDNTKELFFTKIYNPQYTKEIWMYGLDEEDDFEVVGVSKKIKLRLIGGQNDDKFSVENGKNIFIYEYKSKKNTFAETSIANIKRTDEYNINTYDYKKIKTNTNQIIPIIGANPDDGFKVGINNIYTLYGFERNPFTARHQLKAALYFATNGYELNYTGEIANVIGKFNLQFESIFQSANFSQNFFGYGNETINQEGLLGLDYNRVKVSKIGFAPSLIWKVEGGSNLSFGLAFKAIKVEDTENRFITNNSQLPKAIFENRQFLEINSKYQFENFDNKAFATIGMKTSVEVGFVSSIEDYKRNYGYLIPEVSFNHKLISSGQLVLATKLYSHILFNDNYEFYQAASIGGANGLRGFRNQRFTGKSAFYQNTDIRYSLNSMKTKIIPIRLGLYGGFDYGRIWVKEDNSSKWNNAYGGGFFINGADVATANIEVFNSIDGIRIAFTLGFQF